MLPTLTGEGAERLRRYLGRTWAAFTISIITGITVGKLLKL